MAFIISKAARFGQRFTERIATVGRFTVSETGSPIPRSPLTTAYTDVDLSLPSGPPTSPVYMQTSRQMHYYSALTAPQTLHAAGASSTSTSTPKKPAVENQPDTDSVQSGSDNKTTTDETVTRTEPDVGGERKPPMKPPASPKSGKSTKST